MDFLRPMGGEDTSAGWVMESDYGMRFGGIGRLYGLSGLERLRAARVCVVGVGGVGSWAAEALARTGVGGLTVIDMDDVCVTNTNRQLPALDGTLGQLKVDVVAARARLINPECEVEAVADFFTASSAGALLEQGFDVVVDCIDDLGNKALLLAECRRRGIRAVTCGGAGGKRDPTAVLVDDLARSGGDALLKRVRSTLRKEHGFAPQGDWGIPCVFSREKPVFPGADGEVCAAPDPTQNLRLDCASGFGTATFVTGSFGFAAAAAAVEVLLAADTA
jgi:tRNA A37 threonylcarbamoyladenosine dehydratase